MVASTDYGATLADNLKLFSQFDDSYSVPHPHNRQVPQRRVSIGCFVLEAQRLLSGVCLPRHHHQQVLDEMESYQEEINGAKAAALAAMEELEASAAAYHQQLQLCHERLETLPQLTRVDQWLDSQAALFAKGEYGDTKVQVRALLASLELYLINEAARKEVNIDTRAPVNDCELTSWYV